MLRIGEFSRLSKTTIKALRYYDETGLLRPAHIDPDSGYRFYLTEQLFVLHRIQSLRQIGLSIDEIQLILAGRDPTPLLRDRRCELESELTELLAQLSRIDFILQKSEGPFMQYVATIKDLPACTVYAKKLTAPDPSAYFSLIPAIGEQMCRQYPALKCAVPEYCFFVSLDSEYRDHDMHLEFCEAVETAFPDFEDIVFKTLEPVRAVTAMHKGPYETLSGAYAFLTKWVEENGYVMTQRPRESQIDGIWNQEDPANWLTEVQFPIAKQV